MTARWRALLELPRPAGCGATACARTARSRRRKLDSLRNGIDHRGIHYGPIEAALDRVQGTNVWLTFAIREGKNREVRNVLGHLGLAVTRLIRVSFGPFQLGELAEGAVEEVPTRVLREQLGEKIGAFRRRFLAPIPCHAAAAPGRSATRRCGRNRRKDQRTQFVRSCLARA